MFSLKEEMQHKNMFYFEFDGEDEGPSRMFPYTCPSEDPCIK